MKEQFIKSVEEAVGGFLSQGANGEVERSAFRV